MRTIYLNPIEDIRTLLKKTMMSMMTWIPFASGVSGFLTVGTFFGGTTFFAISGSLKILVTFNNITLQDTISTH